MTASSIQSILLFITTASDTCIRCCTFLRNNNVPSSTVKIIRLDSEGARRLAMSGKNIRVDRVPALVVLYIDGTYKMYFGMSDICNWMNANIIQKRAVKSRRNIQPKEESESDGEDMLPSSEPMYYEADDFLPVEEFSQPGGNLPAFEPEPPKLSTTGLQVGGRNQNNSKAKMTDTMSLAKQLQEQAAKASPFGSESGGVFPT